MTVSQRYIAATLILGSFVLHSSNDALAQCQVAVLAPNDPQGGDSFGARMAMDGDYAVIAAPLRDEVTTDAGAVYVFKRTLSGWTQQAKIAPVPNQLVKAGQSGVDISGDLLGIFLLGIFDKVYLYRRSGETWTFEAALALPAGFQFVPGQPRNFAIDGDRVVITGSRPNTPEHPPAIHIYHRTAVWSIEQTILSPLFPGFPFFDVVDLNGDVLAVRGPTNTISVYYRQGTNWVLANAIPDPGAVSLALSGDYLVAATVGGSYLYKRNGFDWQPAYQFGEPSKSVSNYGTSFLAGNITNGHHSLIIKQGSSWAVASQATGVPLVTGCNFYATSVALSRSGYIVSAPNFSTNPNCPNAPGLVYAFRSKPLIGSSPSRIYVNAQASQGGDGLSWATAFRELSSAIELYVCPNDTANNPEIWVASGTYRPTTTGDRVLSFEMQKGLRILGGFAGTETLASQRNPELNVTILSGDLSQNDGSDFVNRSDNSLHVVTAGIGVDSSSVLDGFTIRGGHAAGANEGTSGDRGGGMSNELSSPTVRNCVFTDNYSSSGGSGMSNWNASSPTVENCIFLQNRSNKDAAGILNNNSSPTVIGCVFDRNKGGVGDSSNGGGAVSNYGSQPTLTRCTFIKNECQSASGGAVYNTASTSNISRCRFLGNSAGLSGGALYVHNGSPAIINCEFSGNSSGSAGGAMFVAIASPAISSCTFANNTAAIGGGAIHCAINSFPALRNCVLWNNGGASQVAKDPEASPSVAYCDIQGGWSGPEPGNVSVNPLFVDANGPDDVFGTADDNLAITSGSPCIDAGDNASVPSDLFLDLAGHQRRVDVAAVSDSGNGVPPLVDLGAFEFAFVFPAGRLYVNQAAANESGNGATWTSAIKSLDRALLYAGFEETAISEIWVAAGQFIPSSIGERESSFQLRSGLALYGGFAGAETTLAQRDLTANVTILNGDLDGDDGPNFADFDDNSFHVVSAIGTNGTAILDGFTIRGGFANGGSAPLDRGAGMLIQSASPTVRNCLFKENAAASAGGGLFNGNASPTLSDCTFVNNFAPDAGAMYSNGGGPIVTGCVFNMNTADANGGALFNLSTTMTASNCEFNGNTATAQGGAYYGQSNNDSISQCNFAGNTTPGIGGAVSSSATGFAFRGCKFSANTAGGSGGAASIRDGSLMQQFTGCTFVGNSAAGDGGAIDVAQAAHLIVLNSLFSGNSSGAFGGAINMRVCGAGCDANIRGCTFSRNGALYGGALHNDRSVLTVTSSILWANMPHQFFKSSNSISSTFAYCDIGGLNGWLSGGACNPVSCVGCTALCGEGQLTLGSGNVDIDPQFIDPNGADNIFGTLDDDVHIQNWSPVVDGGEPGYLPPPEANTDIDGQLRIQGLRVDIGADEVAGGSLPGDIDGSGAVTLSDLPLFVTVLMNGSANLVADMNADGNVNGLDVQGFASELIGP